MHPIGPGFFIFFQNDVVAPIVIAPAIAKTDEEVLEILKIIFSFLMSEADD